MLDIQAEGPFEEWKERLPRGDRIAKTLCAFANGDGGTLWVGVSDRGEVLGLDDPDVVAERMRQLAARSCNPPVEVEASVVRQGGHRVVRVSVAASEWRPVAVLDGDERLVCVREGSFSRGASAEETSVLAGMGTRPRLDATDRRVLSAIAALGDPARTAATRKAGMGPKAFKRSVVRMMQAGLVMEKSGKRLWLTPQGCRQLERMVAND